MFDHIGITVADLGKSRRFYEAALSPLGYRVAYEDAATIGLGKDGTPALWLSQGKAGGPVHVALSAPDRRAIGAFHEAALAAGGRDNGGPGPRPQYHATYYAAFALDPDGNNVEAVCHAAEGA